MSYGDQIGPLLDWCFIERQAPIPLYLLPSKEFGFGSLVDAAVGVLDQRKSRQWQREDKRL
jgi:hypothetical protein